MSRAALDLRKQLHAHPELSGREFKTAGRLKKFFDDLPGCGLIDDLAGTGFAVAFAGARRGPTVMLRSELDALPIEEKNVFGHRSLVEGVSHKCGHDGHMAILASVAERLSQQPPARGEVVLLFQPAEETGQGALAMVEDPRFESLQPDRIYALHNLPGYPLGQIVTRPGAFSCASRGFIASLTGVQAHAAQPETGKSPSRAMCRIISMLDGLPGRMASDQELAFATVVGATLGARAFGTAPGAAEVMATIRSERDDTMTRMVEFAKSTVAHVCEEDEIGYLIEFEDVFPATFNDEKAVADICSAAGELEVVLADKPFRWSEDFGHFTSRYPGAMFGLGAGVDMHDLHHPEYDFPDELIEIAAGMYLRLVRKFLDGSAR